MAERELPKLPLVNPNTLNWWHLTETKVLVIGKWWKTDHAISLLVSGELVVRVPSAQEGPRFKSGRQHGNKCRKAASTQPKCADGGSVITVSRYELRDEIAKL
jgi:hypothetical protein